FRLAVVGPRDAERHLLGRVDAGLGDAEELVELVARGLSQLEPWSAQAYSAERLEIHSSFSGCGWPSMLSSAMSRRKKRDVVQSVTTRSFRERSGSWYRWYVRVTNQPGKPRSRTPMTSAIPW